MTKALTARITDRTADLTALASAALGTSLHRATGPLLRVQRGRRDRGDVPGWVLITVMTAGLVAALWAIAGPQLQTLIEDALKNSNGKG